MYCKVHHPSTFFPQMRFRANLLSTGLIGAIGQLKELMKVKGQQGEQRHVIAQIVFPMTLVMLNIIALVLECIETFVFYFPSATSCSCHHEYIVWRHVDVCHPAVCRACFTLFVDNRMLKKINTDRVDTAL